MHITGYTYTSFFASKLNAGHYNMQQIWKFQLRTSCDPLIQMDGLDQQQ